jgi:hypothetical protein
MRRFKTVPGLVDESRMPLGGKIRLGYKEPSKKTGKEYPVQADHFVLTDVPEIAAVFGEKPTELEVLLPHRDPEEIMPVAFERWNQANILMCTGNGIEADERPEKGKEWVARTCPCSAAEPDEKGKKACSIKARLRVILPTVNVGEVYTIETGSRTSINNVMAGLRYARNYCDSLNMVPAIVRLVPKVGLTPDGIKKTNYVLTLGMPPFEVIRALRGKVVAIREALASGGPSPVLALPEADTEDDGELAALPPARALPTFTDPGEDVPPEEEEVEVPARRNCVPADGTSPEETKPAPSMDLVNWSYPPPEVTDKALQNSWAGTIALAREKGFKSWDALVDRLLSEGVWKIRKESPAGVVQAAWDAAYGYLVKMPF